MEGTISNINQRRGMVAVKTAEGSFSIFDNDPIYSLNVITIGYSHRKASPYEIVV